MEPWMYAGAAHAMYAAAAFVLGMAFCWWLAEED